MTTDDAPRLPVEYQGAAALATALFLMPDADDDVWPDGVDPVVFTDRVANMVVFTVNGVTFHAVITAA